MATATIGSIITVNNWGGAAGADQVWEGVYYNMAGLGRMILVNCYFAAMASGGTGTPAAWLSPGTTIAISGSQSIALGTGSSSGGVNYSQSGDVPADASFGWAFGCWASKGVFAYWHNGGTAAYIRTPAASITDINTGVLLGTYLGTSNGAITAYGTYFIVEMYVRRSGAWTKIIPRTRRSGVWPSPDVYVRRSGGWTQVAEVVRTKELDWKREEYGLAVWPDGLQEPILLKWDYDQPRYIGNGYPGQTISQPEEVRELVAV